LIERPASAGRFFVTYFSLQVFHFAARFNYGRAMKRPAKTSPATPSLVNAAASDDEFTRRFHELLNTEERAYAEPACREFLRQYPRRPEAHYLLARALLESKKKREAFPYAEAAHKLAPDNPHFAYYLGYLYMEYRLHEFALPLLRKAVTIAPNVCQFQEALGECYQEIGMGERAVGYLEAARKVANDPTTARRLQAKLAVVLTTSGQYEKSKAVIAELLASDDKLSRDAGIIEAARISKVGAQSPEGLQLQSLLSEEHLTESRRIDILLTLGGMHERDKNYDAAFASWTKSREILKAGDWILKDHEELYVEATQFYTPQLLNALQSFGHPSTVPVFIVGMPRSGTTLTEQIIAAHPQAVGVGELARFNALDRAFRADYPSEQRMEKLLRNAKAGELKARAEETLRIFDVVADVKRDRVVEKTPHNFRNVGYLRLLFPKARFIHCRRHPLDAFISAYQNNLNPSHGYAFSQTEYLKEYLHQERMMDYWKSLFPEQILTLHYEDMAQKPEVMGRELLAYIGLPWHDDCLRFFEKAGTVRTLSTQQIREPVHATSVERWRRYEKHLGPFLQALEESGFKYRA
jgi:tetratricopeptide (TPR) repeat protein